jgi:uracil-DNA glycosylase
MSARPLSEILDPGWAKALEPVAPNIAAMGEFLREEKAAGRETLPEGKNVLRAFKQPFDDVKVLIVGQDPYPTKGNAVGLSFSVGPDVPVPRSLVSIYTEYMSDLDFPPPKNGDLTPWTKEGVLLLNRALSVERDKANSHQGKGWEAITEHAVRALAERGAPLVAILWGANARQLKPLLGGAPAIESAHPSPLSAHRGFFGSHPFTRANASLVEQGAEPVNWRLPAQGE